GIQVQIATGRSADIGDLLRLDQAIAELRVQCKPEGTSKIELIIVDDTTPCKFCGKRYDDKPPPKESGPVIDGEVLKPKAKPKRKALPAPAAPAGPRHPGGIHEQPGARMAVLDYSHIPAEWP